MAGNSSNSDNNSSQEEGQILSQEVVPISKVTNVATPVGAINDAVALQVAPASTGQASAPVAQSLPTDAVQHSALDDLYMPHDRATGINTPPLETSDTPSQARFAPAAPELPILHNKPIVQNAAVQHPANTPQPTPPVTPTQPVTSAQAPSAQHPSAAAAPVSAPAAPTSQNTAHQFKLPNTTKPSHFGLRMLAIVAAVLIAGIASALASYRFAPQIFYSVVPVSITQGLNALWPLHSSIAEMLPADTAMYGSIQLSTSDSQGALLQKVASRIPGVSLAEGGGLEALVKDQLDLSLATDIKPVFETRVYLAIPDAKSTSLVISVPIKNMSLMKSLMKKMQTSAKTSQIIANVETVKGVDVYTVMSKGPAIMDDAKTTSILSTVLPHGLSKSLSTIGANACYKIVKRCVLSSTEHVKAQDESSDSSLHATLSLMVLDNQLVMADSVDTLAHIITQSHSSAPALSKTSGFMKAQEDQNANVLSLYINPQSLDNKLYQGVSGIQYTLSAEEGGLLMNTQTSFDAAKIDPILAKIFTSGNLQHNYAKELPASTALYGQINAVNDILKYLGKQASSSGATGDAELTQAMGVSFTDLASVIKPEAAIAYVPQPKSALVFKGEVTDGAAAMALVDKIEQFIKQSYGDTAYASKEPFAGGQALTILFNNPLMNLYGYSQPIILITGNQLIIGTNKDAVLNVAQAQTTSLTQDEAFILADKSTDPKRQSTWFLHTKRFYNGVVSTIRDVLGNADIAQSDQEKVIDAMLDVFPSVSGSSYSEGQVNTSVTVVPVVELAADKKAEIEKLIKTDAASIFSITPFLAPFRATPSQAETSDSRDELRIEYLEAIAGAAKETKASEDALNHWSLTGIEKLNGVSGQESPAAKKILTALSDRSVLQDPQGTEYYFTLESDDKTYVRAAGLTENKFEKSAGNCQEPKPVRGRFTYCVEEDL